MIGTAAECIGSRVTLGVTTDTGVGRTPAGEWVVRIVGDQSDLLTIYVGAIGTFQG